MKQSIQTSLEKIPNLDSKITNANIIHKSKLSKMDKLALWITNKVGSMGFFIIIFTRTLIRLGRNTIGPIQYRFDPSSAFVFWLFISNLIQIMLMPLIMIGQSLQSRHSEIRAESDYNINMKAEMQIEKLVAQVEAQNKTLSEISEFLTRNKN